MRDMEQLLEVMEHQSVYAGLWKQYLVRRNDSAHDADTAEFELSPRTHGNSRSVRMIVSMLHPAAGRSDPDPEVEAEIASWRLSQMQQRAASMQTLRDAAGLMQHPADMPPLCPMQAEIEGETVWYLVTFYENYERLRDLPVRKINLAALTQAVCEGARECERAGLRHGRITADNIYYDGAARRYYLGRIAVQEGLGSSAFDPVTDDIEQIGSLLRELTAARRLPLSDRQRKAFAQIIRKCLPDVKQRYRSVSEILADLPQRRSRIIELCAGGAAVLLAGTLIAVHLHHKEPAVPESSVPEVTLPAAEDPDAPLQAEFGGHIYTYFPLSCAWEYARRCCEDAGGTLMCINSAEEQRFLEGLLKDLPADRLWLGGSYDPEEQKWYWDDGTEIGYTNWEPWFSAASGNGDKLIVTSCAVKDVGDDLIHAGKWQGSRTRPAEEDSAEYGFFCEAERAGADAGESSSGT